MKLKNEFIVHNIGDETLLVPTAEASFHGLVQGNKTVDTILSCLKEDTTEEKILDSLKEKYDGDEEDMRADIADVIKRLRAIGAIDE
ncbi:PqqD family protein [uncultured Ruminococcus sp.]|uniref:PqqD family protein n=1 Tax=uncultured Ruminococcus sp. TaxID=165186 RepID=UPI002931BF72|nr:PqqD family protein [uncultured Ruminococcus sp.]